MMVFKLALKNLLSNGIRTWLTALVLSLTLMAIIFMQALMAGMMDEMTTIRVNEEIAGGQIWHPNYDPFDPLTWEESNAIPPGIIQNLLKNNQACPLLVIPGAIYPKGRFQSTLLKGVDPNQTCLKLDFTPLNQSNESGYLAVMIGKRYTDSLGLDKGDLLTIRWRTRAGAFDALDAEIIDILNTSAPIMDQSTLYLSHDVVNRMNGTENHSTLVWVRQGVEPDQTGDWILRDVEWLMRDTLEMVRTKTAGQSVFFILLLFLGLIAIFDTQALAVFRRKKEIGTFMAMGMSNRKVVYMLVVEGAMHGILATLITLVVAGPLFFWISQVGMSMGGVSGEDWGMAFGDRFFPVFNAGKVFGAVVFVNLMVVLVSFWPTRQITKLLPAEALRGRLS